MSTKEMYLSVQVVKKFKNVDALNAFLFKRSCENSTATLGEVHVVNDTTIWFRENKKVMAETTFTEEK